MTKSRLVLISTVLLASCSTTQTQNAKAFAAASAPIVEEVISVVGGQYGPLAATLYGMAESAWAGQPVAVGSNNAAITSAVLPLLPSPKTGPVAAALLDSAAAVAQSKAQ